MKGGWPYDGRCWRCLDDGEVSTKGWYSKSDDEDAKPVRRFGLPVFGCRAC